MVSCVISQLLVYAYIIYLYNLVICSVYWLVFFTYIRCAPGLCWAEFPDTWVFRGDGMLRINGRAYPPGAPCNLEEDILYMIFLGKDTS